MNFIEIQDGISINIEKIDGIQKVDDNSCKVYVGSQTYLCTMPYSTLVDLLKNEQVISGNMEHSEEMKNVLEKAGKVLEYSQHFAG